MPETIDPAIAGDWLAIGDSLGLAPGTGRRTRLLGHDLHEIGSASRRERV